MDSSRLRILLVEDNPVEASLAQKRLEGSTEHFDVTHATTVAEALDCLRATAFDAALVDLSLPDSGGIDVLDRIAALDPHLPIVVLTGLNDEAIAAEAIRKGAQDYLVKGEFSGSLILRAIRYARQRKHAEEALRREQEFARALLENVVDGVVACDENFRLMLFNRTAREWHGLDALRIPPERWADHYDLFCADGITPMSMDSVPLARAFRGETLLDEALVIRAKGQPPRHVLANCAPFYDDQGRKLGAVAVMHDITERKLAEEVIYREKMLSESIINSLPGIFYLFDERGRFHRWNKNFEYVTGYSAKEFTKIPSLCLFVKSDRKLLSKKIQAAFAHGVADAEACLLSKDGRSIPYDFTAHRVVLNGQPFVIGMGLDITERKRAEDELRKYREHLEELVQQRTAELVLARDKAQAAEAQAEAANRAKSVFLASMSHELRTPLNAVLGFSQLMRTEPTLNESQKENLDIINRSGTHLLGLINDVLEMSRIEAGRLAREETNFDLWNTLDTITEMVRSRAKAKGLRFVLQRDPTLPRYIKADERKLKQIIINLAGNAVKFTHHGEITLRARADESGTVLLFEVEDTGPGIDAQALQTLFEPFAQGSQNQEGAGLGLFISQKLVGLMGGQIAVQSELDKGSLFSFDIHCESVTAEEIAPQSVHHRVVSLAPGQKPPRVLVAEDTPESRLLMTKTLRSTGFEVVEAEDGMQAVQLFDECQPDLVLMDMRMPVMDGYEAIQRIRSAPRGKTTPIIAVTASAFVEDRHKILAIGADNFISKPMQAAELFEKIRLLLGIVYIYAEERADDAAAIDQAGLGEMVVKLPEDLADELAHAMAALDLEGFAALLPKVAQHNSLLAEKLNRLANSYRVTDLAELFPMRSP